MFLSRRAVVLRKTSSCSRKILRPVKSTASNNFLKPDSALTAPHVPHLNLLRSYRSPPASPTNSAAGKPRPQTTNPGLEKNHPSPELTRCDRCFWITVSRFWSEWKNSPLVVKPEIVVYWHRRAFRTYWRLKSRVAQAGRKPISQSSSQPYSAWPGRIPPGEHPACTANC